MTDQRLDQRFRLTVPEGDHLERAICDHCGFIDYHNPRVVVGALPIFENRILLARRAIEPRRGYWTVPGGFMEKGESLQQGAARETWEECMARIEVASGFIRKDQFWRRHHGSGHGHSLPLTRTELMGQMVHPMFQIQGIQQGVGALR